MPLLGAIALARASILVGTGEVPEDVAPDRGPRGISIGLAGSEPDGFLGSRHRAALERGVHRRVRPLPHPPVPPRQAFPGRSQVRVERDCLLQRRDASAHVVHGPAGEELRSQEMLLVGLHVAGPVGARRWLRAGEELHLEHLHDCPRHLVLNGEDVGLVPVESLRPEVPTVGHVHDLGGDAQAFP